MSPHRATPLLLLLLFLVGPVFAGPVRIAIIIDDLGDQELHGRQAVALPGAVTLAFLPGTPHAAELAEQAHRHGKEVMLHLPMESVNHKRLGPGGLTMNMTEHEFLSTVRADLASIPYVRGVNNHMGSLLTRAPGQMDWLMTELSARGDLYFVDSRTTRETVAARLALEHNVPTADRNVFLDNDPSPKAIRRQLRTLLYDARREGMAIAIGHPHPGTLAVLARFIPTLAAAGVELVPVSQLIQARQQRSSKLWQASLSPSPRAAKSSKR